MFTQDEKLFVKATELNRLGMKEKRADIVQWLTKKDGETFWLLIDETSFNTWCSYLFGRLKVAKLSIPSLTTSKRANFNVLVSILVTGVLDSE